MKIFDLNDSYKVVSATTNTLIKTISKGISNNTCSWYIGTVDNTIYFIAATTVTYPIYNINAISKNTWTMLYTLSNVANTSLGGYNFNNRVFGEAIFTDIIPCTGPWMGNINNSVGMYNTINRTCSIYRIVNIGIDQNNGYIITTSSSNGYTVPFFNGSNSIFTEGVYNTSNGPASLSNATTGLYSGALLNCSVIRRKMKECTGFYTMGIYMIEKD